MRLRIVIFILVISVIGIGIATTTLWFKFKSSANRFGPNTEGKNHVPQVSNDQRVRFQWAGETLLGSDSKHSSGLIGGFSHMYTTPDGTLLFHTGLRYSSEAQTARELKRKLSDALRIIEEEPNVDKMGTKVGVRVVAIFPYYSSDKSSDAHKTTASVLLTNKNNVSYIESSSLEHALEFEKSRRNY